MNFSHRHYVPCLRWKQGEYQAVLRLSPQAKDSITPLIEVPEMSFDFEKGGLAKTVDAHLAPFAARVKSKWGTQSCFVDSQLIGSSERIASGALPAEFIFSELRSQGCVATPVTGLDRDEPYQRAIRQAIDTDQYGACLRIRIEEASQPNLKKLIDVLLKEISVGIAECDLVLDLGAPPNFEPLDGFAKLVCAIIGQMPYLRRWRTFTFIGTSFPPSMGGIAKGVTSVPRFEWLLYKSLIGILRQRGHRLPAFGDYAVNHPDILPLDMRFVRPSATIRYTTNDAWSIFKGQNVRDNGYEQYRDLCQSVIESSNYTGATFSYGDEYIGNCAQGKGSTGNLSTWRKVGTNHHLTKVVSDIASLFGPSDTP